MTRSNVHFLDLPNEILFYILNKLDNVDVLYSFFGINNERLESLIQKKNYSNVLNLTSTVDNIAIIERFCNIILPGICSNVKYLIVEPILMERIFLTGDYSNLTELKLVNFQRDNSLDSFTDQSPFRNLFKQQIRKVELINIDRETAVGSWKNYTKTVYSHLLTYFEKLEYFNVIKTTFAYPPLSIRYLPSNTFSSSTLTYLCIIVIHFTDCLCLLDGRLKQLRSFNVQFYSYDTDLSFVKNFDDLPNLSYFSLIHYGLIEDYDNQILSLVHRMLYLEKLTLYLRFDRRNAFIDPISMMNEFSMNMSQLRSFKFYFSIDNKRSDLVNYLSNNHNKKNYINAPYQQVSNCVSFTVDTGIYHMFTLPFEFPILISIGNVFPNIIFNNVTELYVQDVIPFGHEFFLRIAQAFPSLKTLCVCDFSPMRFKAKKSSVTIQSHRIVEYLHLMALDISKTNTDCIEQFLNQTKTSLPCLTQLTVTYEGLRNVTEDFTRDATRRNCINITRLITGIQIVGSKDYHQYFPLL